MRGAGAAFAAGGDLGPEPPGWIRPTASRAAWDPGRGGGARPSQPLATDAGRARALRSGWQSRRT